MNLNELLQASALGLPMVVIEKPVQYSTSNIGQVVVIKSNARFKGCAVQFPGLNYDTWFTDSPGATDKRTHYMHELSLTTKQ